MRFERHYNSILGTRSRREGWQWKHSYERSVVEDGTSAIVLRETGKAVYFEGAMIDITAQKREEQARNELANILEKTSDIVLAVNPSGTLRYVNKAGRALFNLPDRSTISHHPPPRVLPW